MEKNISPEKLRKDMGTRLKHAISKSGLSKEELLDGLHGVSSQEAFKNYLVGRSFISIPNILILGERLGCGYEYLLTGEEKSESAQNNTGADMEERLEEWKIMYQGMSEQCRMAHDILKMKDRELEQLRSELDFYRSQPGGKASKSF